MDKILTLSTAELDVDFEKKFLLLTWNGKVELDDYKNILTKAVEISGVHNLHSVIINRLKLEELSTECRIWMKSHFLKTIVKPLIPKLSKVATVESKSVIGQVYTSTISKTVGLIYPNLKFKSFKTQEEAMDWVGYTTEAPVQLQEDPQDAETAFQQAEKNDPGSLIDKFFKLFFKSN